MNHPLPVFPIESFRSGPGRILPGLLLFLFLCFPLLAQKKDKDKKEKDEDEKEEVSGIKLHHSLEGGFTLGGQLSSEVFVYKSGISLLYATEAQVSSRVFYGLGLGMERFNDETFFPLFASFKGMLRKKDNTPFLAAQFGYAFGTSRNFGNYEGYDFDGGVLFSPGFGYRFSAGKKASGLMGVYYKHQFARVSYQTYDTFRYRTPLNYDLISFRVGIML